MVILGLTALAHPIAISLAAVRRDLLVAAAAALVPLAALGFGGRIPSGAGAAMLAALAAYLWLAYRRAKVAPAAEEIAAGAQLDQARPALARRSALPSWMWRSLLLVFGGLGILGTCAVVRPQVVDPSVLWLHTPVMLALSLLLLPLIRSGAVISRREGALLLAGYGVYLWWLIR